MRVALIVLGSIAVFVLLLALGGYVWWQRYGDSMIATAQAAARDGQQHGRAGSDVDCWDKSVELMNDCASFECSLYTRAFSEACFRNAGEDAGLCDRVPHDGGLTGTLSWIASECPRIAPGNSQCGGVLQGVVDYCASLQPGSGS